MHFTALKLSCIAGVVRTTAACLACENNLAVIGLLLSPYSKICTLTCVLLLRSFSEHHLCHPWKHLSWYMMCIFCELKSGHTAVAIVKHSINNSCPLARQNPANIPLIGRGTHLLEQLLDDIFNGDDAKRFCHGLPPIAVLNSHGTLSP